jgi:hypothetical protein
MAIQTRHEESRAAGKLYTKMLDPLMPALASLCAGRRHWDQEHDSENSDWESPEQF